MRSIRIALASTAVAASIVGSAYAAEACTGGPGSDPSHHHGDPSATASATSTTSPQFKGYRWTHHQYRHHHQRHFGWWKGWHSGWFWHHGKPVHQHPTPTPTPSDTATPSAAPSAS